MNIRKVFALFASCALLAGIALASAPPASADVNLDCQDICRFDFGAPDFTATGANEVGLQFSANTPGWIAAICFWQAPDEPTGNHTVTLWDGSGSQLRTASGLTRSGQENCVSFRAVPITEFTTYTASYTTTTAFALWPGQFQIDNDYVHLHAGKNAGAIGAPGSVPSPNSKGNGYGVDVGFLTTLSRQTTDCPATLTAPTKPTSGPGRPGSAVVSWWPATSDPDGCVLGYVVTPYLNGAAQPSTLIPGTGTTTVISDLTLGASYTFTIAGESGITIGPQSVETGPVTIGTPAAASALQVSRVSNGAVKVAFKAPRPNGAAIRNYTATCQSPAGATRASSGKSSPLRVTRLTAGKQYRCTVRANNRYGSGPPSSRSAAVKA